MASTPSVASLRWCPLSPCRMCSRSTDAASRSVIIILFRTIFSLSPVVKIVAILIHGTTVPVSLSKWFANYLSGRQVNTNFMGDLFSSRIIRTGVPQGSVPSPTLFKFYVHDAVNYPPEFKLQSYAKYFHPFVQSRDRIITCPCYFSIYLKELTFFY